MNGITLERDHHNGHWNDDESDFDHCVPVLVHAESEDEAEAIRDHLAEAFDDEDAADVTPDGRFDADAEPSLPWLEQLSLEGTALVTRIGDDETRNFRVTVLEIDATVTEVDDGE